MEVTPDLIFKYQLETKDLADVLKEDMARLNKMYQPSLVNEQLGMLYQEIDARKKVSFVKSYR